MIIAGLIPDGGYLWLGSRLTSAMIWSAEVSPYVDFKEKVLMETAPLGPQFLRGPTFKKSWSNIISNRHSQASLWYWKDLKSYAWLKDIDRYDTLYIATFRELSKNHWLETIEGSPAMMQQWWIIGRLQHAGWFGLSNLLAFFSPFHLSCICV